MFEKLDAFIFGNVPFSCESEYALEESVSRLQDATKRSVFSTFFKENAIGKVSNSAIKLSKHRPFHGNNFKPFFYGKFKEEDGKTYLEGKFTTSKAAKKMTALWAGMALIFTAMTTIQGLKALITNPDLPQALAISLSPPVFAAIVIGIGAIGAPKFGRHYARKDIDYLKNTITKALSASDHTTIEETLASENVAIGKNVKRI